MDETKVLGLDRSNVGPYDLKGGFKIDGSRVKFWASKKRAIAAADLIGFRRDGVEKVYTRFQIGYALLQYGGGFVTREEWAEVEARLAKTTPAD
jgi:hypothetical protein